MSLELQLKMLNERGYVLLLGVLDPHENRLVALRHRSPAADSLGLPEAAGTLHLD